MVLELRSGVMDIFETLGAFRSRSKYLFPRRTIVPRSHGDDSAVGLTKISVVEYAIEAIKLGSTTVGIKTKEGVVLGVEKRVQSPLLEASSIEKIMEIDTHLGCAMSGKSLYAT
ncbi:proteasome component pup2 [Ceratobasidium sp. 395]|nr:proteasome component pup2 [Ceratobasidium sp. 395]